MDLIILAGGLGTRLRASLPADTPKALAPINGHPFLLHLMATIPTKTFEKIILAVSYKSGEIIKAVGSRYNELEITYSIEQSPLGTGGAILQAQELTNGEFLVINGDTYINVSKICTLIKSTSLESHEGLMIVRYEEDASRYGKVIQQSGLLTGFREKTSEGPGLINAGCYFFKRPISPPSATKDKIISFEQDLLPALVKNRSIRIEKYTGTFIDIGVPESYELSKNMQCFKKKKL